MTSRTAVIGAGIAGLSCARVLRRAGHFVEVFEAEPTIAGRMATMRIGVVPYDHGAQYVSCRGAHFREFINELKANGYAADWSPKIRAGSEAETRHATGWMVGVPGMSSLVRPLAEGVKITTGRRVYTIARENRGWTIWFDDQTSVPGFHAVAICAPAPQARLMLGPLTELSDRISKARMSPCWALLARLDDRHLPEPDVYSDMSEVIRWVARNNTKPNRKARGETIVVHASPAWTRETEDADPKAVAEEMWDEVCHVFGLPPVRPSQMTAHLWKHGLVEQALGESYVFSGEDKVGCAGDWCLGRLSEHGYESGFALGRAIVSALD